MISIRTFLDSNGVIGIPDVLASSLDSVMGPALQLCFAPVPPAPVAAIPIPVVPSLSQAVVVAVTARAGAPITAAPGLLILMNNLVLDINTLIVVPVAANAAGMNILPVPKPPTPVPPIMPTALATPIIAPNALKFGKAALEWAASFIEGDPRAFGHITVLSVPSA